MKAHRFRSLLFAFATLPALAASAVEPNGPHGLDPNRMQVQVQGGLLTVDAHDAPLAILLEVIGEEADFDVMVENGFDVTVTKVFTDVPLEQGLRRLLAETSFMMSFKDSEGTKILYTLRVYAALEDGDAKPHQPAVTAVEEPSLADTEAWILDRLKSPQRGARIVAVRRLARLEPEAAARIAARVLETEADSVVRGQTAATLGKIGGDGASSLLQQALADEAAMVRMHAIRALRLVGAEQATTVLGRVLTEDPDQEIRLMALETLIATPGDTSQYYLALAATHPDEKIRQRANQALQANKDPSRAKTQSKVNSAQSVGMQYRGSKLLK